MNDITNVCWLLRVTPRTKSWEAVGDIRASSDDLWIHDDGLRVRPARHRGQNMSESPPPMDRYAADPGSEGLTEVKYDGYDSGQLIKLRST